MLNWKQKTLIPIYCCTFFNKLTNKMLTLSSSFPITPFSVWLDLTCCLTHFFTISPPRLSGSFIIVHSGKRRFAHQKQADTHAVMDVWMQTREKESKSNEKRSWGGREIFCWCLVTLGGTNGQPLMDRITLRVSSYHRKREAKKALFSFSYLAW